MPGHSPPNNTSCASLANNTGNNHDPATNDTLIHSSAARPLLPKDDCCNMPDLNSVPASPRILSLSRRTSSQQMPPPSVPASGTPPTDPALNILPSNLNAVTTGAPVAPSLPSPRLSSDAASFISGPGPMRHPRPLTHAELHSELEKEGEAVVCLRNSNEKFTCVHQQANTLRTGQPPHPRARPPPPSPQRLRRIQCLLQLRECLRLRSRHPHHPRRQTAPTLRHRLLNSLVQRASP